MRQARMRDEKGAALISVIFLVAIMSMTSIALLEVTTKSIRRAKLTDNQSQINWMMISAEEVGHVAIGQLFDQTSGNLNDMTPYLEQDIVMPVLDATLLIRVEDASNCFNLNAMLSGRSVRQSANQAFLNLLIALKINENEAESLRARLLDWLDHDNTPRLGGAEDSYYAGMRPSYRAADTQLVHVSDLRAIRGYTQEIYEVIEPYMCALNHDNPAILNVNTLNLEQAPLLTMATGGTIDIDLARNIIEDRPVGGWESIQDFADLEAIKLIETDQMNLEYLSIQSKYLSLIGQVQRRGQASDFQLLYVQEQVGQPVKIIQRVYGVM